MIVHYEYNMMLTFYYVNKLHFCCRPYQPTNSATMGKSMRSKRKQKLKRERREKFKVKELKKLKDMLRAAGEKVDDDNEAVMVDTEERKSNGDGEDVRSVGSRSTPIVT